MEKKIQYVRCPRCELNFIPKKEKLCSVCQAELSSNKEDLIDELDLELCPICKTNYIQSDEIMCSNCLKERGMSGEEDDFENNTEWNSYINQEEDDFIMPNEDTGELAIVDMDDEDLDEDLVVLDDEDEFSDQDDDDDEDDDEEDDDDEDDVIDDSDYDEDEDDEF